MVAFAVMIFGGLSLKFVGQLFLSEILLAIYFLLSWLNQKSNINQESKDFFRKYFLFLSLAIMGQVVSDIYRGTEFASSTKGFFLLFFTMLNLAGLIRITQLDVKKYFWALSGWSLGLIIHALLDPPDIITNQSLLWKFGVGYPITLLFFIVLSIRKLNVFFLFIGTLIISIVHFINDARSLALFTLLSSFVVFFSSIQRQLPNKTGGTKSPLKAITQLLVIFVSLSIVMMLYLENQNENSKSAVKYREQTQTALILKPLSLLVSARSELIPQFYAVKSSPIIGYGSYALNTEVIKAKTNNFLTIRQSAYLQFRLEKSSQGLIPTHSSLFQNWVWFGILGVPFFLLVLVRGIRSLVRFDIPPILIFLVIQSSWDVVFSPYAGLRRIQYPLLILGLGIFALNSKRKRVGTS